MKIKQIQRLYDEIREYAKMNILTEDILRSMLNSAFLEGRIYQLTKDDKKN